MTKRLTSLSCICLALVSMVGMTGCTASTVAQRAETSISVAVAVAQAEAPLIPVADQAGYNGFVALAVGLNTQLSACVSNASGIMGRSSKFLACFNAFAAGVASPAELAQLRLLSPSVQAKVQVYVAAIVAGVNVAVVALGGKAVASPSVSPSAQAYIETATGSFAVAELEGRMKDAAGI